MRDTFGLTLVLAFGLTAASCHAPARPPARHARSTPALLADARPSAPGASTAPPPASTPADDETRALVAATLGRVSKARALAATTAVASRTLDRAALIAQVRGHVEKEVPREAIRAQGEFLLAFGLIPPTYNFEQGMYDLLEAQLAGYYEPADKTMYLAGDLDEANAEATLAHELVHALQDQHYSLADKLAYREDNGDVSSALQCLAEGDATSAMFDVMLNGQGTALDLPERALELQMQAGALITPASKDVPPILKASLVAPYIDGLRFVNRLRRRGGWAAVDKAWRRLPVTTEQLLHVEKYDANEPARAVPTAPTDVPGGGFKVAFSDLLGEQSMRLTFEEWGSRGAAEAAAAGWGGDRISLLTREHDGATERVVVWWLRFDNNSPQCTDAAEAFRLVAHAAAPAMKPTGSTPLVCADRPVLGPFAVARSGCDVVLVGGPHARRGNEMPRAASNCAGITPWLTKMISSSAPSR